MTMGENKLIISLLLIMADAGYTTKFKIQIYEIHLPAGEFVTNNQIHLKLKMKFTHCYLGLGLLPSLSGGLKTKGVTLMTNDTFTSISVQL